MGWTKGKPRKPKATSDAVDAATGAIETPVEDTPTGAFTLEMEDAPEDTFPEEDDSPGILKNILGQLGLKGSTETGSTAKKQPATKLNARQKQFCETFTPLASGVLVLSLTWGYTRINEMYRVLAPSQEVATNIVAPLVRIYARQAKFVNAVNPNYIDAAASLTAFIGYVMTTFQMYQQIKAGAWDGQEEEETYAERDTPYNIVNAREDRHSRAGNGREDIPVRSTESIHAVPGSTRYNANNDGRHDFTDAERYQFEKLSLLRERDFESRARRSGRYGNVRASGS